MKFKKNKNFSEWYSEVIQEAELADLRYNIKGFIVNRWLAVKAMKLMYALYEDELERTGHKPHWFPALIPEKNFVKEAEHAKGFAPEVFWVSGAGSSGKLLAEKFAMRPTSETAIMQMFKEWIRSWRDLPYKLYQDCQIWRYETKATRPFLRGREFHWIETHCAFVNQKDAEVQVLQDMKITEKIMHKEFAIPFMFFRRPEWDKFKGAVYTFACDSLFPNGKIVQQPSTHYFGTKFAQAFDVKFIDKNEKEQYAHTTAYGPAIWRMMGSLIATHGDDKGLIFPPKIAPVQVVIVPILFKGKEKVVLEGARELHKYLKNSGLRVELDLTDKTPGNKFYYWELRGTPIRIEIGPRDISSKSVTMVRRDTGVKSNVKATKILEEVNRTNDLILIGLKRKADAQFSQFISSAKTYSELKEIIDKKGGLVRTNWCSVSKSGEACAKKLKDKTTAEVRGVRVDKNERPTGNCIICGKPAKVVVYIGKAY